MGMHSLRDVANAAFRSARDAPSRGRNAETGADTFCTEFASIVRYARGTIADGRIEHSDVQEALGTRLLMLSEMARSSALA